MTDPPSSIGTLSTHHSFPTVAPTTVSPELNGIPDPVSQDDPEDYTIKCICSYGDDDGSTVYCEKCDTWQHIVCYYQGKKVPEVHFCADCDPRDLDAKRATDIQRRLREGDDHEQKSKRSTLKSHKKKRDLHTAPDQPNGTHGHGRHESMVGTRDQPPPAKRAKTNHRASASVASLNGIQVLPDSRKRASSSANAYPSPTKSPPNFLLHPPIPMYTTDFLNLYENDRGKNNVDDGRSGKKCTNSMTVAVTHELTSWYDNPAALKRLGLKHPEVFHQSDQPLRPETWPRVVLKDHRKPEISHEGRSPRWKSVVLDSSVKKDAFIGEIKGDIGLFRDYCHNDFDNRWKELRHPDPFVFFHPSIPIYIDSRGEGTEFRYVRRSCRPNLSLKTFVTGDRDFHHCFVAKENIPASTELTTSWYLDQDLFDNGKVKQETGDEDEAKRRGIYCSKLLANFGDCACCAADCALIKHDLRTPLDQLKKRPESRRSRAKSKNANSPPGTGHAVNSRENSETIGTIDEDDLAESRSTSGSVRSKPHSRDITPANLGSSGEQTLDVSAGISAREKRKILMAEKAFEDQETKTKRPKRKRASNGPPVSTSGSGSKATAPTTTSLPTTPSLAPRPPYLNTSTARNSVASPPLSAPLRQTANASPHRQFAYNTPSPLARSVTNMYVDQGMQTDPDPEEAESLPPVSEPRLTVAGYEHYAPPMLKRIRRFREWEQRDKAKKEDLRKKIEAGVCSPYATFVPSWLDSRYDEDKRRVDSLVNQTTETQQDTVPTSSSSSTSPDLALAGDRAKGSDVAAPITVTRQTSYPFPSQAAHSQNSLRAPLGQKLQLSTLPPVPAFSTSTTSTTQTSTTFSPTPTTPSISQSPFSHLAPSHSYPGLSAPSLGPSPVKKKLSLGDYMSRRSNLTTPTAEKTLAQASSSDTAANPVSPIPESKAEFQSLIPSGTNGSESSGDLVKHDQTAPALSNEMEIDEGLDAFKSNEPLSQETQTSSFAQKTAAVAFPPQPLPDHTMTSQLSSVISNLQALAGKAARAGSDAS